jgi:hypothetical protein
MVTMSGPKYGLTFKGPQDDWLRDLPDECINARKAFLNGRDYRRTYQPIKFQKSIAYSNDKNITSVQLTLENCADFINNVDLVVNNHFGMDVDCLIKKIETVYGGVRFDILNAEDLETQINTNAAIFKSNRVVRQVRNKLFIPLHI